jgi:thiamine pyrophosphokinase
VNDLHKCVGVALSTATARGLAPPFRLVALGALGGRLDHTLANLSMLHAFPELDILLVGRHSTARLLRPGKHVIVPSPRVEGPVCGLIPLGASSRMPRSVAAGRDGTGGREWGTPLILTAIRLCHAAGPAIVSSSGLKWDMDNTRLAMGELVRVQASRAVKQQT